MSFFSAPQLTRDPLGGVVTQDNFTSGERFFRAAVVALLGAVAGLFLGLALARKVVILSFLPSDPSFLLTLTLVGAGLGALLGFWLTDYAWKRVLRVLLPFRIWP